ncbi:glycosyltransferase family 2 protein [Synechococcus sp. RSCCF101]|uniref:glycosyltransferase n=1 Tax=Synechococcus sp. RSCCF101 TaxID=2511069 RepID=UPI0012460A38|nr:glycosyltransferase family 2 protein [Synechococcus sp. RSCCF101]QEY32538.1 glycosyltransferase family 2 protein [Synechococcus sp. RSCCF101]
MAAMAPSSERRRLKAAAFALACGCVGVAPHWFSSPRNLIPGAALALLLGGFSLRTVLPPRRVPGAAGSSSETAKDSAAPESATLEPLPSLDLVVAARDEQEVIGRLVQRLLTLPARGLIRRVWVVDDGSEDRTGAILRALEARCPELNVLQRGRGDGGGKSGALNAVLPLLSGDWLLVLDADAQLQDDALERLMSHALTGGWSAVQTRKAVVNADENLLTRAQAMEMVFDAEIQEARLASGGIAELRGNGELLRREALLRSGGFNEATVTDDLDLSFRLLLAGEPVGLIWDPPVQEEAVRTLPALWRQRQRWAEGGLQRFFDYWPGLVSGRLTWRRRADLTGFFLMQYALPVVSATDLGASVATGSWPVSWPVSLVALTLSGCVIAKGCSRPAEGPAPPRPTAANVLLAVLYFAHWFVVIPWVTVRMALLPKRLVWAKTSHQGPVDPAPPGEFLDPADLQTPAP